MKIPALVLVLSFLALSLRAGVSPASSPTPLMEIFRTPGVQNVQVSPDGKRIALIHRQESGIEDVAVMELASGKIETLGRFPPDETAGHFVHWKGNDFLIYGSYVAGGRFNFIPSMAVSGYDLRFDKVIPILPDSMVISVLNWMDFDPDAILIANLNGG
ncbi:MAG TPA: hypothetical protein VFB27_12585, partial [Opitutaceae bacterium]|nr:hypothetical protein [Opitutaceae bacterium]